jgi:hypothetical protein
LLLMYLEYILLKEKRLGNNGFMKKLELVIP